MPGVAKESSPLCLSKGKKEQEEELRDQGEQVLFIRMKSYVTMIMCSLFGNSWPGSKMLFEK